MRRAAATLGAEDVSLCYCNSQQPGAENVEFQRAVEACLDASAGSDDKQKTLSHWSGFRRYFARENENKNAGVANTLLHPEKTQ